MSGTQFALIAFCVALILIGVIMFAAVYLGAERERQYRERRGDHGEG